MVSRSQEYEEEGYCCLLLVVLVGGSGISIETLTVQYIYTELLGTYLSVLAPGS